MKILWLSHLIPYPPKSGVLMRSYHLIREVAKYHEVDLIAFNQRESMSSYFRSSAEGEAKSKSHLSEFLSRISYFNIPSESGPCSKYWLAIRSLFTKDPYTINWLKSDEYFQASIDHMATKKYDLIHFDTISLVPFWGRHISVPCVLDHHNIESHMMLRRTKHENNLLKRLYYYQEGKRLEAYEKRMLSSFNHHIVCSSDDGNRLSLLARDLKITVIPNGISMPDKKPIRHPANPPHLLFIGGLNWYPNRDAMHYFLDHVWPRLKGMVPDIFVDIIGKFPSEKILQFARNDKRITVYGYVDDITPFYNKSAIYICPIRDGGGTKLKVLDALANGIPLVADSIACEGLDIVHGVHGLKCSGPEEMAAQIVFLLQNPSYAEMLKENGYQLVKENYNFQLIGKRLSDLYVSL